MTTSRSHPVLIPKIAGQKWSCHSCGNCCRTLVVHVSREERERIDRMGWAGKLDAAPYVPIGRGWALNKREDGRCVFLDENTLCRIHSQSGEEAKPLACRLFPFSVRPVVDGWQTSLRFDCPSIASPEGEPLTEQRGSLTNAVRQLDHAPPAGDGLPDLQRRVHATAEEVDALTDRFARWFKDDQIPLSGRLTGAARITTMLEGATFKKVRGSRLVELLDLLFGALPSECATCPTEPTARQRAMLRQLAFAHTGQVTLAELRAGFFSRLRKRREQVRSAKLFRAGSGPVPPQPGLVGEASFEAVEAVVAPSDRAADIEGLLLRYVAARFKTRTVFGEGYYGWPVFAGLAALWLAIAAAGWLARHAATVDGRNVVTFGDVATAIGLVDRAATRVPALGTMTERARLSYLLGDDGVARLINRYSLLHGVTT